MKHNTHSNQEKNCIKPFCRFKSFPRPGHSVYEEVHEAAKLNVWIPKWMIRSAEMFGELFVWWNIQNSKMRRFENWKKEAKSFGNIILKWSINGWRCFSNQMCNSLSLSACLAVANLAVSSRRLGKQKKTNTPNSHTHSKITWRISNWERASEADRCPLQMMLFRRSFDAFAMQIC